MQEEVTQKTIALVIKTAKLDANVLKAAMRMYLNHRRQKAQKTHGKTSVKKLVGEGVGVSSIEVTDGNIKSFERVARKYNIDFAIKKDKTIVTAEDEMDLEKKTNKAIRDFLFAEYWHLETAH